QRRGHGQAARARRGQHARPRHLRGSASSAHDRWPARRLLRHHGSVPSLRRPLAGHHLGAQPADARLDRSGDLRQSTARVRGRARPQPAGARWRRVGGVRARQRRRLLRQGRVCRAHARELLRQSESERLHANRHPAREGRASAGLSLPAGCLGWPYLLALAGAPVMMNFMRRPVPLVAGTLMCVLLPAMPGAVAAQEELPFYRVEGTIIGSLPPQPLAMPASRNHNYWGFRLLAASHLGRRGADFDAIAGGVDLQWRGGSTLSATVGYQRTTCEVGQCNDHLMFETRGRFNFLTGGPTIAGALGDDNASTTVGFELGIGYSPDVAPRLNACAFDIGMPVAIAMLQSVRLVVFAKPSVAWDFHCGG